MSVVIMWDGLPMYAARLIAAAKPSNFQIVATPPTVPIRGMDDMLLGRIKWIPLSFRGGFSDLCIPIPRLLLRPSWNTIYADRLEDEVRAAGGSVVVMFDNPWRGNFRQLIGAIRFRTLWHNRFCAAWVAGQSGARLARFFGFKNEQIFTGMYGAAPDLFKAASAPRITQRFKRLIFVGQLIPRKGIYELLTAWKMFMEKNPEWELHVYGTGSLEDLVKKSAVVFHGFQQPNVIAAAMQQSRFLVLPSYEEHWGLVVCEAAQAGCGLILSQAVGSGPDLLTHENGVLVTKRCAESLRRGFELASMLNDSQLERMQDVSLELGSHFTPEKWANVFSQICQLYHSNKIMERVV